MAKTRTERDTLGHYEVPADAYYGSQTARAVDNFPISGLTLPTSMIRAMAVLKLAASNVHQRLGVLDDERAAAIAAAARELGDGRLDAHFVVDAFQAGAGTSFHMNANEVIANRANELLGHPRGTYTLIHPNDHVNMGQSTNDVFPTAMRLAILATLPGLLDSLAGLVDGFRERGETFAQVVKSGRTHLQDALPITLGQEFGAYGEAIARCGRRIASAGEELLILGIGGTAVGSGLNAHPGYRDAMIQELAHLTGLPVQGAPNLFESMQSLAPFADLSAALRGLALELIRIANDLRLMASGPRTGLGELWLPPVQPGSSIMPGKVNPSMPEMLDQVCFQVLGNDTTIAFAVQAGQLELNVMMPVVAHNLISSLGLLANGMRVFDRRCVRGASADQEVCFTHAMSSVGLGAVLNPIIGYQQAAEVVKQALREGRTIPEIAVERGLLEKNEAERIFAPGKLTTLGT